MTSVSEIRRIFLDYFVKNNHTQVASSPLVPRNDPSLMFANSGMVQFKNIFTGGETRDYKRAVTAQKCVRAGGKHNDLDNVGYTARHHTFFEMLGNFSFGDYFKEQAIAHAWQVVVGEFGLPKDKLYVTVYADDDEAAKLWQKIAGLSQDRIIRINTNDNFWQMGDTGPCGPCSEIFYDHGDKIWGGLPGSAEQDGDRFVEIWNLVFMQYEQFSGGKREKLPKPSIDTGMGLERIAAVLQGKHNNYDIDLMRNLIMGIADKTNQNPDGALSASFKIISDHLRAGAFLIADGVLPANEGRGYVLRRILRRGMRHAHLLGCHEPLMHQLVPYLIKEMGGHYGELIRAESLIRETMKLEESRFIEMLGRGLKLLEKECEKLGNGENLSGLVAFTLYDTFGFPLDLTQDILRGQNRQVDLNAFQQAMQAQKTRARAAWAGSGEVKTAAIWLDIKEKFGASEFFGYDTLSSEGIIQAIVTEKSQACDNLNMGDSGAIILNQTPFYGESGGQMGDKGIIAIEGNEFQVLDTQKYCQDLIVHFGKVIKGNFKLNQAVICQVDKQRRQNLRAHHSATHLLHKALRDKLGNHVTQKGSQVGEDSLRFDFAHNQPISGEDLRAIELAVNQKILTNTPVTTKLMSQEAAIESGALALFGEKYGAEVRVLMMGEADDEKSHYSVELCGGTHVSNTGDIGLFLIDSQESVAAGVRRITAKAGLPAVIAQQRANNLLNECAQILKSSPDDLLNQLQNLQNDKKKLEKDIKNLRIQSLAPSQGDENSLDFNGFKIIARIMENYPAKDLKPMADKLKSESPDSVLILIAIDEAKRASIVVSINGKAQASQNAVDLVKLAAVILGGTGGGGRPDMAQAGGADGDKAQMAIEAIINKIKS